MISFCYTEDCYRAFILDYFGDRSHASTCGKCGNCLGERANAPRAPQAVPLDPPSALDRRLREHSPAGRDLEYELDDQSRRTRALREAETAATDAASLRSSLEGEVAAAFPDSAGAADFAVTEARELNEAERLCVRKILACAARMEGRFGKGVLAATLRGSRSAKIAQAGLDRLTTYGILSDMTQDEIMLYVDALVSAGALFVTGGAYPMVQLTPLGSDVMRERAQVRLALPSFAPTPTTARVQSSSASFSSSASGASPAAKRVSTVDETYAFYSAGMTIEEICEQRGLTAMTVEKHLADCITEGRPFDLSPHVAERDRALIVRAVEQHGAERLKPLRDALPHHVTYRMIRFVVADLQRTAARADSPG
jgi:ATP-dependent DNA helicase RecQ